jgi:hypothetical protein
MKFKGLFPVVLDKAEATGVEVHVTDVTFEVFDGSS